MPATLNHTLFSTLIAVAAVAHAHAGTPNAAQSDAEPFGLQPIAPVMQAGSDAQSQAFLAVLPDLTDMLNGVLAERAAVLDLSQYKLDLTRLVLPYAAEPRVYFIGEGAGYHNSLAFIHPHAQGSQQDPNDPNDNSAANTQVNPANAGLAFPDSSTADGPRSSRTPVKPGDFVELGPYDAGEQIEPVLIADGANNPQHERTYRVRRQQNHDGIQHVVGFAMRGTPYVIVGFEDLYGGGDRDYNDLLFALEVGEENVNALQVVPEPRAATMMLLGCISLCSLRATRHRVNSRRTEN